MNKQTEALKQALVDDEGENQAVRMFLALYGSQAGITTKQMRQHLEMAGFDGAWPEWADKEMHLTKAGAQLWIRHLFALAEQPAQQEPADTAKIAAQILTYLGFSQDESIHPGADRRRDTVAMMIENAAPQPAQPLFKRLIDQHPGLDEALKAAGDGFDVGFEAGKRAAQQEPVAIKYWLQDTMESGRWVTTDNMAKATAEKMLSGEYGDVYPQGRIVEPSPPAQRNPLTRDQVKKLITATGYDTASPQERTDFINGIRHAEAVHGIKENT